MFFVCLFVLFLFFVFFGGVSVSFHCNHNNDLAAVQNGKIKIRVVSLELLSMF